MVLVYVIIGDVCVDDIFYVGLFGLFDILWCRILIEFSILMGINLDIDELLFFLFIYWLIIVD